MVNRNALNYFTIGRLSFYIVIDNSRHGILYPSYHKYNHTFLAQILESRLTFILD